MKATEQYKDFLLYRLSTILNKRVRLVQGVLVEKLNLLEGHQHSMSIPTWFFSLEYRTIRTKISTKYQKCITVDTLKIVFSCSCFSCSSTLTAPFCDPRYG